MLWLAAHLPQLPSIPARSSQLAAAAGPPPPPFVSWSSSGHPKHPVSTSIQTIRSGPPPPRRAPQRACYLSLLGIGPGPSSFTTPAAGGSPCGALLALHIEEGFGGSRAWSLLVVPQKKESHFDSQTCHHSNAASIIQRQPSSSKHRSRIVAAAPPPSLIRSSRPSPSPGPLPCCCLPVRPLSPRLVAGLCCCAVATRDAHSHLSHTGVHTPLHPPSPRSLPVAPSPFFPPPGRRQHRQGCRALVA